MTTRKFVFTAIACCLLMTSTTFASNTPDNTSYLTLRTELSKMVQNPELAKHQIEKATVALEFTVDQRGTIQVLEMNSTSDYLKTYIEEQINGQKLDSVNYIPGQKYIVRFTFELE
jgi:hypothetical protein